MKIKFYIFIFLILVLFLFSCTSTVKEYYQNLKNKDNNFDYVIYSGNISYSIDNKGYDITVDSKNRILICGNNFSKNNSSIVVWRFNDDGSLDKSFNKEGYFIFNNPESEKSFDAGYSITVDKNDKILVTGESNGNMIIIRLSSNGLIDKSFNKKGFLIYKNEFTNVGKDIICGNNNKIIVTGYKYNSNNNFDMIIWCYNNNGIIDENFNYKGFLTHDNAAGGKSHDYGYSAALTKDNKIIVTGSSLSSNNIDMVVWKYTYNGDLDRSFNLGKGYYVYNDLYNNMSDEIGHSVKIDSNQNIIISGISINNKNSNRSNITLWKFSSDGKPDKSFNNTGVLIIKAIYAKSGYNTNTDLDIDRFNRIYVCASGIQNKLDNSASFLHMFIWRVDNNGVIDHTFNSGKGFIMDNNIGADQTDKCIEALIVDNYNKIYITGYCMDTLSNNDVFIWSIDD